MYEINDVKELIKFIIELLDEECETESWYDSYGNMVNFFERGGCYDLAKAIKHYFPSCEYAVRNDNEHVAVLYNEKLYDASDYFDGMESEKDLSDYKIFTEEEIDNFPIPFGRVSNIKGLKVTDFIIKSIDDIPSVVVNPENKKNSVKL